MSKQLYTEKDLKATVAIYQKNIKHILKKYSPRNLFCFVLEKQKPYTTVGYVHSGFHLHFPFTYLSRIDQDVHLFPRIISDFKGTDIYKNLGIDDFDKIIDCTKKHWLLYGSRKDPMKERYVLTKIYDGDMNEITLDDAMLDTTIYDINGDSIPITKPLDYYLPRILSIRSNSRETCTVKSDLECISKKELIKAAESKQIFENNYTTSQCLEIVSELMPMVSPKRVDDRRSWMELGWILYTVCGGCQEALDLWIEISLKTSNDVYKRDCETRCVWEWKRMKKYSYTIGSLKFFASKDSPEEYDKYKKKKAAKRIAACLKGGHSDLAKMLHDMYGHKFVCASVTKDIWYEYALHKWKLIEQGVFLRKKISTELASKFKEKAKAIHNDMMKEKEDEFGDDEDDGGDDDERKELEKKLKIVHKTVGNLKSRPFKQNVMKEAADEFYVEHFVDKLDSDRYLLGCENGVIDMREIAFREGKPDDYISMSIGYDYKNVSDNASEMTLLDEFLIKIFPDPELREYFLEYCASILVGGNSNKNILFWTGEGDNGKSVVVSLIELTLGKYAIKLPTSILTGKRTQSSQACPELVRSAAAHAAFIQEPNKKEPVNDGVLKELSGNDSFWARGLWDQGKDIIPQIKLSVITNDLPRVDSNSRALWERFKVLQFESTFLHESLCAPSLEEQLKQKKFPKDPYFSEKLPELKQAFLCKLLKVAKKVKNHGRMLEPSKVREATNTYRKNNDVFLQYINECIINIDDSLPKKEDEDDEKYISLGDLYTDFSDWFKHSFPKRELPAKSDMEDDLRKRWGAKTKKGWLGYRFRTIQDDEDEGKIIVINEGDMIDDDKNTEERGEKEERGEEVKEERGEKEKEEEKEKKKERKRKKKEEREREEKEKNKEKKIKKAGDFL